MDIKLKNIKYSLGAKLFAVILIWLCLISALGSGMFLIDNQDIMTSKNCYDYYEFTAEYSRLVFHTIDLHVRLRSEEYIKASGAAEDVIQSNLESFKLSKNRLSYTVNFAYYIKNTETGEIITNITGEDPLALIKKQSTLVLFSQYEMYFDYPLHIEGIGEMISGTPYEVYTAVIEPIKPGDMFYRIFDSYSKVKTTSNFVIALLIISIILMVIAFIYLICVAGYREKGGEATLTFIDRIYIDVHTVLMIIFALVSVGWVVGAWYRYPDIVVRIIFICIILSVDLFLGLSYVLSITRQIKSRQVTKNIFVIKLFNGFKTFTRLLFMKGSFIAWTLLLLIVFAGVNAFLFAMAYASFTHGSSYSALFAVLLMFFDFVFLYFTVRSFISLSHIMDAVNETSTGKLEYVLNSKKMPAVFYGFARNIQSIQEGLKKAVAEAVKGERMKADLITNVSHDLKTPLTSIINYVDLLKKEDLENIKAKEYVNILDEKSARLKVLIEDLVQASKASSGNLTVNAEKVDLHELIMQACGEYEEKIEKTGLDFRINTTDKTIQVLADGKHMWRIIENLMSNVLKYSMPHSRVYISITINEEYGVLTIKNISDHPLDIPPEQLAERFVRADKSRTTEGSGLGLSIAQSLTSIQGGKFKIEIDGDLFKVTVEIPLWRED